MPSTTLSSREFNHDIAGAKRAAEKGPVIVTDRGRPAWVLLRHDEYRRLVGGGASIRDLLDHPESSEIEFDPPKIGGDLVRAADLA